MGVLGSIGLSLGIFLVIVALPPVLVGRSAATVFERPPRHETLTFDSQVRIRPAVIERSHEVQLADPKRILIPEIGVDADIVPLGLEPNGSLEVPEDFGLSGWYRDGPEPGEPGASVIVGHVDSYHGPAVFYGLNRLQRGDEVIVEAVDGTSSAFVVDRVEQHAKTQFPTDAVYGDTKEPTLRLITCGGAFDRFAGSYHDNVVVFAHLVSHIAAPVTP